MRAWLIAPSLLLALARPSAAANLDVTAAYRMKAISYTNLNLDSSNPNSRRFIENDARLGVAVRRIYLETKGVDDTTMDVGILLRGLGVSNSTNTATPPLDRVAQNYPQTNMTPFVENAYMRVHNLWGKPIEATFGRQTFKLGSGLLLDDDGAGLTGVVVREDLGFWDLKSQQFAFNDRDPRFGSPGSLDLFGLSLMIPTEGTWELNQLFERDRAMQPAIGCQVLDANGVAGPPGLMQTCTVGKSIKSFTSARYQINYGPMVFDGEAALEKGAANPTGPLSPGNHITYNGNAEVLRAKWKQSLYKTGEGIARLSLARGSGKRGETNTTDEAFFPAHGHRFDGLERSGFGGFFGASPYDAFGGNYSSTTVSGLRQGASGIVVVGAGYTPPAFHGWVLDLDYFLFRADRVVTGPTTLGWEWDVRIRYSIQDHFMLAFGADTFTAGTASNPNRGTSRKYTFEASGRF